MRIGLLADTHIPNEVPELPPQVKEVFRGVDLILHGGDIYSLSVLDDLEEIAPVLAARGNGDARLPEDPRLKLAHCMTVGGLTLGLAHAVEYPELDWYPLEKSMQRYFGGGVDIVVYGDSHVPVAEECKGVVMVNSGSPSLPWGLRKLGTVGLLLVEDGLVEARIIDLATGNDLNRFIKKRAET